MRIDRRDVYDEEPHIPVWWSRSMSIYFMRCAAFRTTDSNFSLEHRTKYSVFPMTML